MINLDASLNRVAILKEGESHGEVIMSATRLKTCGQYAWRAMKRNDDVFMAALLAMALSVAVLTF